VGAVNFNTNNQNSISLSLGLTLAETALLYVSKIQLNKGEMCCTSKFCNQKCNFPCNTLQKGQDFLKRFSAILFN